MPEKGLVNCHGPKKPWDPPSPPWPNLMGDAPFCDVCGHITVKNGTDWKCLNCGNLMSGDGSVVSDTPPQSFLLYGQGGEKICLRVSPDRLEFTTVTDRGPEAEREQFLLEVLKKSLRSSGVEFLESTRHGLEGGHSQIGIYGAVIELPKKIKEPQFPHCEVCGHELLTVSDGAGGRKCLHCGHEV